MGLHHTGGDHQPPSERTFADLHRVRGEGSRFHFLRLLEEVGVMGFELTEEKEGIDENKDEGGTSGLLD